MATPIGNLRDITLRALDILRRADIVASEDSRVTRKLLTAYGISRRLETYHEHNAARARPRLLAALAAGKSVALVSDAGTPLISDPGLKLVRAAQEGGYLVTAAPGPSAVLAGVTLSGLPTDRFLFAGFLPVRAAARRAALERVRDADATLVFFEAARRLGASLADMAALLGDRDAAVVREATKLHEEVRRDRVLRLAEAYAKEAAPKGEVVVVVAPPTAREGLSGPEIDDRLRRALAAAPLSEAVRAVAAETGRPRREIYQRALALASERDPA